nr:hypothetical protein [Flavobacterium sp.]MCU0394125.1 hypothetical protein [Thermoflexibacter sp.]
GGGTGIKPLGDVPKGESNKDSIYDTCMFEAILGNPLAGNKGLLGKWHIAVGYAIGKSVAVLAISVVVGIIAGVVLGTITETTIAGYLTGLAISVTVGVLASATTLVMDISKANDDFMEDARKEHIRCSNLAYKEVRPFNEAGFKKYLKPPKL